MNQTFVKPSEALKKLNNGEIVYYELEDGHSAIRKISKTTYEFTFHIDGKGFEHYNGNLKSLMKTLNDEKIKYGLYTRN